MRRGPGLPRLRRAGSAALALVALGASASPSPTAASRQLLDQVWRGVGQAEQAHQTSCGTLTETRASRLLARPLVLNARFCTAGLDRFRVEYQGPDRTRVIYNGGTLNVSTGGQQHTEVLDVAAAVKRAQRYFAGPDATRSLERDFSITVAEKDDRYTLLLLPVSGRIARRVTRVAVELGQRDFLPRRIEIDGRSGVNSVFEIQIERLNETLDESLFRVHLP